MDASQLSLFQSLPPLPEGFAYQPDLLSADAEDELVRQFQCLEFREFEFQGYRGKRRVVSFGLHYDFNDSTVRSAEDIPEFLLPLRELAAAFAHLPASDLAHVLITEYGVGAAIGWHKDRPVFEDVVGISLVSPCRFRLRRKVGRRWERVSLTVEPRSAYLLRGPARTGWEHSIPPAEALRYSVTFRTMRRSGAR